MDRIFIRIVPPAALVFAALGSILLGFATPTEAAGCGAMGALLLSLAYKKLTLPKLQEALVKTLEITALNNGSSSCFKLLRSCVC